MNLKKGGLAGEKRELFRKPKMIDLAGREIAPEELTGDELDEASGGLLETCSHGGPNFCTGGGTVEEI